MAHLKQVFSLLAVVALSTQVAGADAIFQTPAKIRVVLAPVLNTSDPKFPGADKADVRAHAARVAGDLILEGMRKADYETFSSQEVEDACKKLDLDFSKSKARSKEALKKLGDEFEAGFVVFAWITDVDQRNLDVFSVLSNLSGPASTTRATVKIWIFDRPSNKLLVDGKSFDAEAKGPRFGTTKRGELSGNPQDVAYDIMRESKKRAEWMGKAARAAIVKGCLSYIGNLDAPGNDLTAH